MRGDIQESGAIAADAYLAWWQLAGVECAVAEDAVDWLRPVSAIARTAVSSQRPVPAPVPGKPDSLQAFGAWAISDSAAPERRWPGSVLLPTGPASAPLMIVTDMPDPADVGAGVVMAEKAGLLLDAMLRAIGLQRDGVYIASLFFARPPGGMVEARDLAFASDRMRTLVSLAAPRRLLVLGDRTNRALLATNGEGREDGLRPFNHDGGTVPAMATFHPRLLLSQPAAKAECWRALQMLIEEVHS